jgi:biopolymer transport protein ExbD
MFVRPKRPSLALDMAPLIDVVFQLLIFFMLSSSFNLPQLSLTLPQVGGTPDPAGPTPLVVSIAEDGTVFVNQEEIQLGTFKARLREYVEAIKAKTKTTNIPVTIRMDGSRPYGEFMKFFKESKDAGVTNLRMIYEPGDNRAN